MALTHADKLECKEIAREIIKEVLAEHIQSCPHGKTLLVGRAFVIGIIMASSILGGSAGAALIKVLS